MHVKAASRTISEGSMDKSHQKKFNVSHAGQKHGIVFQYFYQSIQEWDADRRCLGSQTILNYCVDTRQLAAKALCH